MQYSMQININFRFNSAKNNIIFYAVSLEHT